MIKSTDKHEDAVLERLYDFPEFVTDAHESTRRVYEDKNAVFLVNELVIESYKSKIYDNITGNALIHK